MVKGDQPITELPYIGETTARKLYSAFSSSRSTSYIGKKVTVGEAVAHKNLFDTVRILNKRQQKALYDATGDASLYAQGNFERDRDRRTPGPKKFSNRGDFKVPMSDLERAHEYQQGRTSRSQTVDAQKRARITTNYETWASNPRRFDYPGIDTPGRKPRVQERDLPYVAGDTLMRNPFAPEEAASRGMRDLERDL